MPDAAGALILGSVELIGGPDAASTPHRPSSRHDRRGRRDRHPGQRPSRAPAGAPGAVDPSPPARGANVTLTLLAALYLPLGLLVGAVGAGRLSRRAFKRAPEVFAAKLRTIA